jgi:hypothetical protein
MTKAMVRLKEGEGEVAEEDGRKNRGLRQIRGIKECVEGEND